jgi:hypothetical protein
MLEEISGKLGSMKCLRVLSQSGGDAAAPPVLAADLEVSSSPVFRIRNRRIHMFLGLAGSGSTSQRCGSGSFCHQAKIVIVSSVADPDPSGPYVFEPSGSGSTSQRYESGSFYQQAKNIRKTVIPTVL